MLIYSLATLGTKFSKLLLQFHGVLYKPPFFDGINNNVIFSQALLNTQQETGDGLFILKSQQNGLLKGDYLYFGGMGSFTPVWGRGSQSNLSSNSVNNYALEYYVLSTLGEWTSVYASLNTYTTNGQWNVTPGNIFFILETLINFQYIHMQLYQQSTLVTLMKQLIFCRH
nr:hypothetical protein [Francisella halioticida]